MERRGEGAALRLRAVDDETASGVNPAWTPVERFAHDHLDKLLEIIKRTRETTGVTPMAWKADVDAAFRRIPVIKSHRRFLWVIVQLYGEQ